ncbi:MAG: RNA methyltransferase [Bacteroidetes bacterium]|nr:RNA methyltransferase [Bacteroidota bacterium]
MRKIKNEELGRLTVEEFKKTDKRPIVVVADNVRSLNNIGSIFRTCDAFAVDKFHLCGITATPPNKEIHKTAIGAELSVDWQYWENTKEAVTNLKSEGYTIISIEQIENSVMLDDFVVDKSKKYALILGHEVMGVSQEIADMSDLAIEIPQYGTKHSLNVSVATGVVLWYISKQY